MIVIEQVEFYKAIVIKVDLFGSEIIDEKHFNTLEEVQAFKELATNKSNGLLCVVCQM